MSILALEGFDNITTLDEAAANGLGLNSAVISLQSQTGRYGRGRAIASDAITNDIGVYFNDFSTEIYYGLAFHIDEWSDSAGDTEIINVGARVQTAAANHAMRIDLLASGVLRIWEDNNGFVADSNQGLIRPMVWHYIEVYLKRATSGGRITVWVDGDQIVDFTGNTGSSSNPLAYLQFSGDSGANRLIDDVYVLDTTGSAPWNTRLGEIDITSLFPNGDNSVTWTAVGTGTTNADRVSENAAHDGDTTYVHSSTANDVDLYDMENLPNTPDKIYAVKSKFLARKTTPGERTIRGKLKSGTTTSNGTAEGLRVDYSKIDRDMLFETDPDTAAAWTASGVNAVQAGMEVL